MRRAIVEVTTAGRTLYELQEEQLDLSGNSYWLLFGSCPTYEIAKEVIDGLPDLEFRKVVYVKE